jgi:hypothetical protein
MLVARFVSETPGINGGYPVVAGTRTPIWVLVEYYRDLGDVDEIPQLLPHLTSGANPGRAGLLCGAPGASRRRPCVQ